MDISVTQTENRVVFLDNLRWLLVLFVIAEHASHAYTGVAWWPVADKDASIVAGWISAVSDAFAMPLLFYIAGYFAIPSIEKKGALPFLKAKFKRLGIPWLVCILTICPILPLIYHFTRGGLSLSTSYWNLWLVLMQNFAKFDVGFIDSMNELMGQNQFYQRYMWFLSLLLLFFVIFSLLYAVRKNWFQRVEPPVIQQSPAASSALKYLFAVGLLTSVCSFLTIGAILALGPERSNPEPLFTLGNVIQFRPSRLFFYIIHFGLGLITYRNRWIEQNRFPGHFKTWAISWIVTLAIYFFFRHQMLYGPNHLEEMYGMLFFLMLNFLTITTLGFLTAMGIRYWNRRTPFLRKMTPHSYNMYLSHYIIVLMLQLLFFSLPEVPGLLKFGLVSVLSTICAYGVSHFLIKPFPRLSIAATGTIFLAMVAMIRP